MGPVEPYHLPELVGSLGARSTLCVTKGDTTKGDTMCGGGCGPREDPASPGCGGDE